MLRAGAGRSGARYDTVMKLSLAILAAAAALPARAADEPVSAALAQLQDPRGVCASDFQGAAVAAYVRPEVCLRAVAQKGKAERSAELYVIVETDGKHAADVREWNVKVTGPDGKVVLDRRLAGSPLQRGPCSIQGCSNTYTTLKVPAWTRGTYRFQLVYSPDAEVASTLAVTLK